MISNFNYEWSLSDGYPAKGIKKNNLKVFSCFACGGGSTMGYKLAGYNVLGCNEIDPEMMMIYKKNHNPKISYEEDIRIFKNRNNLPPELLNLDILDGSPPCSSFSLAGNREEDWGKEKVFREGQAFQTLDDLFFDFIELAGKLKPKVVVAENVKGMLIGNAKGYLVEIKRKLEDIGYAVQVFLLNSATMGVPQKRERVFIIGFLNKEKLINLNFTDKNIPFYRVSDREDYTSTITPLEKSYWNNTKQSNPCGKFFSVKKLSNNKVPNTILASFRHFHPTIPRKLNDKEIIKIGSFPKDYDFCGLDAGYVIGMSVPPIMMANIAEQILLQHFI